MGGATNAWHTSATQLVVSISLAVMATFFKNVNIPVCILLNSNIPEDGQL